MTSQDLCDRKKQVEALALKLSEASEGVPHSVMLEALLTLYTAAAEIHHCCTSPAAKAALQAHHRLAQAALEHPADALVH